MNPIGIIHYSYNVLTEKERRKKSIEAKDLEGRTPLHYAVVYQRQQNAQV